ncbi:LANO_0E11298g1_1 [Lachancea nothofagi CBS 11611]|uniref:LANO_0E11298g1_1 n=1 Tax=Lachancea nothofagi CBS 11611 TaxID=1266666 RepID=A0A1G4JXC8_9SACH|nr:LANO_0E11298g1_1 [Lachancea nothofagi CBS 11611]
MGLSSRFSPVKDCTPHEQNYTVLNDVSELWWQTADGNKAESNKPKHSFLSLKPQKLLSRQRNTTVETQTLYFTDLESKKCGFVQLLLSSVLGGISTNIQLNLKLFDCDNEGELGSWETFKIDDVTKFSQDGMKSRHSSFQLIPSQGQEIGNLLICAINLKSQKGRYLNANLSTTLRTGFKVDPDGSSFYSDEGSSKPPRIMRHVFVPQGLCTGSICIEGGGQPRSTVNLEKVPAMFIEALQGISPHKAASCWNFSCFQNYEIGAVCMEYTTTSEFQKTVVTVTGIARNGKISAVYASSENESSVSARKHVKFLQTSKDPQNKWCYPSSISFPLDGPNNVLKLDPLRLVNKYDILDELPAIIKRVVESIAGIKPFIYQYCQIAEFDGESGVAIAESTFISES